MQAEKFENDQQTLGQRGKMSPVIQPHVFCGQLSSYVLRISPQDFLLVWLCSGRKCALLVNEDIKNDYGTTQIKATFVHNYHKNDDHRFHQLQIWHITSHTDGGDHVMKSRRLLAWEDFPSLPQWMIWAIQNQITFMIYTVPTQAQNQSLPLNHLAYLFIWQLHRQSDLSVWTPSFVFSADTRWKVQSQWQSLSH